MLYKLCGYSTWFCHLPPGAQDFPLLRIQAQTGHGQPLGAVVGYEVGHLLSIHSCLIMTDHCIS
jgi:hypothetical protein